jgi:hypothetical protein
MSADSKLKRKDSQSSEGSADPEDQKDGKGTAAGLVQPLNLDLDTGDEFVRYRRRWYQFWYA